MTTWSQFLVYAPLNTSESLGETMSYKFWFEDVTVLQHEKLFSYGREIDNNQVQVKMHYFFYIGWKLDNFFISTMQSMETTIDNIDLLISPKVCCLGKYQMEDKIDRRLGSW